MIVMIVLDTSNFAWRLFFSFESTMNSKETYRFFRVTLKKIGCIQNCYDTRYQAHFNDDKPRNNFMSKREQPSEITTL